MINIKKFIYLVIILCFTHGATANAQDKLNPEKATIDLGFEFEEPNRRVTKKMANNFYEGCLDTAYYGLKKIHRKDFCSCASAAMHAFIKVDEYTLLSEGRKNDSGYIRAYETLMEKVYIPCVADPFFDIQKAQCLRKTAGKFIRSKEEIPKDYINMCNCTGNYVRKYIEEFGASDIMRNTSYSFKIKDPFRALFNHPTVSSQRYRSYEFCRVESRKKMIQDAKEKDQEEKLKERSRNK